MKCELCGNQILNKVKVKDGYICQHCYDNFLESVKISINNFTREQLIEINKIFKLPQNNVWAEYENIKLTDNSIQINNKQITINSIKSIRFNFHPKKVGNYENTVAGIITIVIETNKPHCLFEEPISNKFFNLNYIIRGKNISYIYPRVLENIENSVQKSIETKSYNLNELKKVWFDYKSNTNNGNSTSNKNASYNMAINLLKISTPFTKEDVRIARKKMLKIHHPDVGGSAEMCKKINEAYEVLIKYAS